MADKMYIVVTLRKEVPDRDAGRLLFDQVKAFLSDKPDVKITGHISNHFKEEEP